MLMSGKDAMIHHPLSRVYGSYVITDGLVPVHVTDDVQSLFDQLEGVDYRTASRLRVLLVSSEDFDSDDITAFVWREMVEKLTGSVVLPKDYEDFTEIVGPRPGFIELGFDDDYATESWNEERKRKAALAEREARIRRVVGAKAAADLYGIAAE